MERLLEKLKNQEGFSLSELLVAMAIFGIILTMTSQILISIVRISGDIGQQVDVTQEAGFLTEQLKRGVRSAVEIISIKSLGQDKEGGTVTTISNRIGDVNVTVLGELLYRKRDEPDDTYVLYQLVRYENGHADFDNCPDVPAQTAAEKTRYGIKETEESVNLRVYETKNLAAGPWERKNIVPSSLCFRYDGLSQTVFSPIYQNKVDTQGDLLNIGNRDIIGANVVLAVHGQDDEFFRNQVVYQVAVASRKLSISVK